MPSVKGPACKDPFDEVYRGLRRPHPRIDTLELYSLARLLEPELGEVEEHLLVCQDCRDHVTSLDYYHSALKEALRQARPEIHATEDGLIHN